MDNDYLTLRYNSKSRWLSYWYQISEALEISPASVLVIGKGSGITDNTIKLFSKEKVRVITLDINDILSADIIGNVMHLPFVDNSFDAAICCQVLEHIHFSKFRAALSELRRITNKRLIISLPYKRKHIKISYSLPSLSEKTFIIKNPFTKKQCTSKRHFWEIGRGVSLKQTTDQISGLFDIEKKFFNEINCAHMFFILKRKK